MTVLEEFTHVFEPATRPGAPTLLLLHGTGADEHDLLPLGRALASGAALLSPRGRVDENGMNRWFRRLREGVFDVEDLIERTAELAGFVRAATAAYDLDPERIVVSGFSNGANTGAGLLLLHPGLVAGAALFAGGAPLQGREPGPVELSGTRVFLGNGVADPITTIDQARLLADQLGERGAEVEAHEHPGGHQLPPDVLGRARDWFDRAGF
ncbi:hydrolase [Nocardiopsis terrae]|uniref:Phospholipase/carboxylesterase n=1 Tax=Nocardiopsis terrae TaxID=372655 RepID=A0ABR9HHP6_9ACTN|nr:alpha/beta hydrolase [Nocardiopsis terrae]MBE1458507.1 phospholipase/carboxylesterase [Nocardiopsis terrae]GHC80029.1 hydrolase [Nocardiopsis terrae]